MDPDPYSGALWIRIHTWKYRIKEKQSSLLQKVYDLRQKFNIQRLNRLKCSSNTIIDRYFLKKTVFLLNYFKFLSSSKFGSGSKFKCIWIHNTGLDCTLCTVYICGPVADMDHGRSVLLIYLFWPQLALVLVIIRAGHAKKFFSFATTRKRNIASGTSQGLEK